MKTWNIGILDNAPGATLATEEITATSYTQYDTGWFDPQGTTYLRIYLFAIANSSGDNPTVYAKNIRVYCL